MISLPITSDFMLLLNPQFNDLPTPWQIGLLCALGLLPLLLVGWLYRYELKLVSGLAALGLLAFRFLVIGTLLFLVLLQPVVGHVTSEQLPGQVLIAVDRSESMSVADVQRDPAEKLRLARALKFVERAEDLQQLERWIASYEAHSTPEWVSPEEFHDDPSRRRSVAEDRKDLHDNLCRRVDALTRSDVAQRLLEGSGGNLVGQVQGRHQVGLSGFDREIWDAKPDQWADLFRPAADRERSASAFTNLRLPLDLAEKRSRQDRGRILGVILLTDGRHNWGPSPVTKALELGQSPDNRIPVFPVALGAARPPSDVALLSVKAPPSVFKNVDVPVEAQVKITGMPAGDVLVEMQPPLGPKLTEKIKHDGTDGLHTVRFTTRLDQAGSQTLTVTAKPQEGETRADNNARPVMVNVADDKAKVLLIDGEARWELHYLASALLRDKSMEVANVVMHQPRVGKIAEDDLIKGGNPSRALPAGADALSPFDCIILGDVAPEQLPMADRLRLERYVSDRGGTLVILAGKRSMPLAYLSGDDSLTRLLPIEQPHVAKPADGFGVTLTDQGKSAAFLSMEPDAEQSLKRWADLPRHHWGVVGPAKPGAVTLGYVAEAGNPEEVEKSNGLIVRQNFGFGRVLFVGLDSTWRWRYKSGDTYHHRFWGQTIRWAASDKPLTAGNEHLRFGTREPSYKQRQDVDVVVRLAETIPALAPDTLAAARVLMPAQEGEPDKAVALVPLKTNPSQPRLLQGQVNDLLPGRYEIELVIPTLQDKLQGPPTSDGKPGKLRAGFAVLAPEGEELVELATNWPLLEELAVKSGGKLLTPETASEVVDLIANQVVTHTHRDEQPLWQSWIGLVLVLGLLTVEWVVRKRVGLP